MDKCVIYLKSFQTIGTYYKSLQGLHIIDSAWPPSGNEILSVIERCMALSRGLICTKRVHLGVSEIAFIERCPHVRGGL